MSRTKLRKFKEIETFSNVLSTPDVALVQSHLHSYKKCILELGCGKAEYTLALAQKHPDTLVIGVERKGERIWKGAKVALEQKQTNTFFLRMDIRHLPSCLPIESVDELWITFPDPFPKKGDAKRRLVSPEYLLLYKKFLKKKGLIHLKTDVESYFFYAQESLSQNGFRITKSIEDVHQTAILTTYPFLNITTTYEKKHLEKGRTIYYLQATRT